MNIYLPDKLYKLKPVAFFILATISLFIPVLIFKYIVATILYVFTGYIIVMRQIYSTSLNIIVSNNNLEDDE